MGEACVGTCADLHYPQLRTVIWGVLRTNVSGDEDGSIREEVARAIWDANTASASLTDEKFDQLAKAPHWYANDTGQVIGPGTFVYYAKLGGWEALAPASLEERYGDPAKYVGTTGFMLPLGMDCCPSRSGGRPQAPKRWRERMPCSPHADLRPKLWHGSRQGGPRASPRRMV